MNTVCERRGHEFVHVICETFDKRKILALNTHKYEAVPIGRYLGELNMSLKEKGLG